MLSKPWIYTLVREDRISDFVLLVARAYTSCDALLDCSPLSLDTQNFWSPDNTDCAFVAGRALREVNENAKGGGKAVSRVRDRGWIVRD